MTTKALLVADVRTGGTYLCCALSNQPQIFCVREEPFHKSSVWKKVPWDRRLMTIFNQKFYDVAMCKITPSQLGNTGLANFLVARRPKIVYLTREKVTEQAASDLINNMRLKGHPTHTFSTANPPKVTLDPKQFVGHYNGILKRRKIAEVFLKGARKVSGNPAYRLTYESLIALPNPTMKGICNFLGVKPFAFVSRMKKVHSVPYAEFVTNWDELIRSV